MPGRQSDVQAAAALPTPGMAARIRRHLVIAGLLMATALVAGLAFATKKAGAIEAFAFVTGALCVWLVVRQSVWNFPLGLLNVAAYSYVFYNYKLYADAGLQIAFFGLIVIGWYLWLYGGERRTALKVSVAGRMEWGWVVAFIAISTLALWALLTHLGGAAKFWDALTTSISLAAQWWLSRKRVENWHLWIVADIIYVPLYVSRGLYLTAILYMIFLVMAVLGLLAWRRAAKDQAGQAA
jgi:nicotinamide mononucleotide transporter